MNRTIPKPFNYKSRPLVHMRSPTAEEQRIGEIIDAWLATYNFSKKDEDKYKEAFKSTLKAYIKKTQGKRLKDLLLSRDVLPMTLMVSGAALAALLANEGDIPSIPDIELTKKLKVSAEVKGSIGKFTSVVITEAPS
ncbi:MAG: hypothetical protein SRB2_02577 [Desulfobacteraceae bacterium Eth-SRB2]|nr:MAG: hypothetical protein SRB2_02577 [Desulfobacteraceae bacterium Eth-SRB2]